VNVHEVGGERVDWNAQNPINGETVLMKALSALESNDALTSVKIASLLKV
jgi:hypothetical protein